MAGLKQSEKRLLTMFGIALFVVANLLGDSFFAKRKTAAAVSAAENQKKITEYELLLLRRDTMLAQRSWLEQKQPRFVSEESAATDIENHVKQSADAAGATIDSSKPTEPETATDYIQVALEVKVSGSAEEVTRFVSLIQSLEGFYAIPSATYTIDRRDTTILRCSLKVARWYSTNTSSPGAATVGAGIAASSQN